jgi:hypothetical protein
MPERLRNLSITYSDAERVEKWPEKLKSHDDDQTEHSSCGGYRRGVSMQRDCTHCMHKVHKIYKCTIQRGDGVVIVAGIAMLLKVIHVRRRIRVQQLKITEEELCSECTWRIEHKKQKNIMGRGCMFEDSEEA